MSANNPITVTATIDFFGSQNANHKFNEHHIANNVSKEIDYVERDVNLRRGFPGFLLSPNIDDLNKRDEDTGDLIDASNIVSKLGDTIGECENFFGKAGYNGFVSSNLGDVKLRVSSTNGEKVEGFVIAFDAITNEYASQLTIETVGQTPLNLPNHNPIFGYRFDSPVDSFDLTITEWSKNGISVNRPVRITSFAINYQKTFNALEIISLEASREMVAENSEPSYGVVGQYGSLEILDSQGIMLDFARYGVLDNNLPCKIKIKRPPLVGEQTTHKDTCVHNDGTEQCNCACQDEVFGEYLTGDWTTEFGKGTVSVDLRDETDSWNDVTVGIEATETNLADDNSGIRRTDNLIRHLLGVAGVSPNQIVFDAPTSTIFQRFSLERASVTEQLSKIAWLNQLAIYKRWDGRYAVERFAPKKTVEIDENGIVKRRADDTAIMTEYRSDSPLYTIPPTKHTGTIKFNPVVDNRIDKVTGEFGLVQVEPSDPNRDDFFYPSQKRNSRNPLQLDDNVLFHERTTTTVENNQTIRVTQSHTHLAEELLREYARGKQTIEATLLSGDYMSVRKEELPRKVKNYIPKAGDRHIYLDESLRPMSNYVNGYPKEFVVTSVILEFSMDSGVAYKVTAQEIALY